MDPFGGMGMGMNMGMGGFGGGFGGFGGFGNFGGFGGGFDNDDFFGGAGFSDGTGFTSF